MPNKIFNLNCLDGSISSRRGVRLVFIYIMLYRNSRIYANSVDPDKTPHSVAPDLGPYCLLMDLGPHHLLMSLFGDARHKRITLEKSTNFVFSFFPETNKLSGCVL